MTDSDSTFLWDDILSLVEESDMQPQTAAMLRSCSADGIDGDTLCVITKTKFVKATLEKQIPLLNDLATQAAFTPMKVRIEVKRDTSSPKREMVSTISEDDLNNMRSDNQMPSLRKTSPAKKSNKPKENKRNPLVSNVTENDSKLTFETFVEGEENQIALQAAKGVADGDKNFNPLFIYGKSGLGKTHLLKAIQNYVITNDPSRVCVYKTANDFISDFTNAMSNPNKDMKESLEQNYQNIDILIIDDIQNMRNAARTITFFFDTFNHLINNGKQIVLAADVPPLELGMEERVTSRLDGGFSVSIQVPSYELKYTLISSFYKRMKEEGVKDYEGEISEDCLKYMAEVSGTNIRLIKAFCQSCLYMATKCERNGSDFDQSMVKGLAKQRWSLKQRMVTVEEIQQKVEEFFSISHNDLIGSKRNKEIMEPRHIAIWLTRTLTDDTLAEIGKKFGGRSHATIKHSVSWVDQEMHENHLFFDRIERLKEELSEME